MGNAGVQVERECELLGWGVDYGEGTKNNKRAKTGASFEDVATHLAETVARIVSEVRPADEALMRENERLKAENERLKSNLRAALAERDDYAVECFEMRAAAKGMLQ